ncbi:MAG: hypothetical protein WCW17_02040 [Patescibacteria group bacterium]
MMTGCGRNTVSTAPEKVRKTLQADYTLWVQISSGVGRIILYSPDLDRQMDFVQISSATLVPIVFARVSDMWQERHIELFNTSGDPIKVRVFETVGGKSSVKTVTVMNVENGVSLLVNTKRHKFKIR